MNVAQEKLVTVEFICGKLQRPSPEDAVGCLFEAYLMTSCDCTEVP